ncbi:MAG: MipA/OmpV family protein [Pseudomonadota bacterium]
MAKRRGRARRISSSLLLISIFTACVGSGIAKETQSGGFFVTGVAALPEYEGADDNRVVPFFVGRRSVFGFDTELEGLRARLDLLDHAILKAGPAVGVTLPRNDSFVDELSVQRLEEVDTAFEVGGFVGFEYPIGRTAEDALSGHVAIRQDVLGAHDGLVITPELEYFFKVNRMLRFGLGLNATWANGDYHDTYFSINAPDALASGLTEFQAEAGFKDVGVEVYNILSFSETWGVFSRVAYNRLLGDAADSPVAAGVGSEDQLFYGLGVFYRW